MESRLSPVRGSIVVLAAYFSCGGTCGSTAPKAAPHAYDQTLQEPKCDASADAQPLLVGTPANERAEIELAMHEGIVVAAWDCKTLRLLRQCKVDGSYAFSGTPTKKQVLAVGSLM